MNASVRVSPTCSNPLSTYDHAADLLLDIAPTLNRSFHRLCWDRRDLTSKIPDTILEVREALKGLLGDEGFPIFKNWLGNETDVDALNCDAGIRACWKRSAPHWHYSAEEALSKLESLAQQTREAIEYVLNPEQADAELLAGLEWNAENPAKLIDEHDPVQLFTRSAEYLIDRPKTPHKFVVDRWIPEQFVSAFSGDAGLGKTTVLLHMGICVAAGKPFFGSEVQQGDVLAILSENTEDQIGKFIEASCEHIGADAYEVASRMFIESTIDRSASLWNCDLSGNKLKDHITQLGQRLRETLAEKPNVRFVLLDSQIDVYQGNPIDNHAVARFLEWLTKLAKQHNIGIALICHEAKSSGENDSHAISGGMAWRYKPKSIGRFERGARDGQATLKHTKHSFSPAAMKLALEFQGGIFVAVNNDTERQCACRDMTLEILSRTAENDQKLSPASKASNYAPRFMADNQGGSNFSMAEYEQAIDALLTVQKIGIQTYRKRSKMHQQYVVLDEVVG